jgi:hypothetical protein
MAAQIRRESPLPYAHEFLVRFRAAGDGLLREPVNPIAPQQLFAPLFGFDMRQ